MQLRRQLLSVLITAAVAAATAAVPTYATTNASDDEEVIDLGSLEEEETEEAGSSGSPEDDQGGNVSDQLAAGSGVRVSTICTNCNAANVSVNGLSGDRVGINWDGVGSPGGLASVYWLTQFPGDFIGYTGVAVRNVAAIGWGVAVSASLARRETTKHHRNVTLVEAHELVGERVAHDAHESGAIHLEIHRVRTLEEHERATNTCRRECEYQRCVRWRSR